MNRPTKEPIGLRVTRTAKALSRAFDQELAAAGGTLPTWLILLSVKSGRAATQRELAKAVGIEGATLTHHLTGLESAGLIARTRDPDNRRVQRVELTEDGDAAFARLRKAAERFDTRLRRGLEDDEVDELRVLLGRLEENVGGAQPAQASRTIP
ncbi:MAG: MarR family winged helix-turn-helix transcriptional regulator [Thermoleophilaceae bacterium]